MRAWKNAGQRVKTAPNQIGGTQSVLAKPDYPMQTVLIVVHLMIVLALVGVVLLQRSEGGGLGIGGGSGFMTARGAANALTRATAILPPVFLLRRCCCRSWRAMAKSRQTFLTMFRLHNRATARAFWTSWAAAPPNRLMVPRHRRLMRQSLLIRPLYRQRVVLRIRQREALLRPHRSTGSKLAVGRFSSS